jgi:N-methylhydantoinase A/oxoprolinase/acetone carboxylase beta subunit
VSEPDTLLQPPLQRSSSARRYALSIDVGGTFTDFVLVDLAAGEAPRFHKVLTTPAEPARAVITGWRELLAQAGLTAADIEYVVHGTTLVTNAIVERRGAHCALITTGGFRDVLEIGIEQLYSIYDLFAPYPAPLIPRERRHEVTERLARDGSVIEPLDEAGVRDLVARLAADGVESIAVALIHAYRNGAHERRIADIVREMAPEIAVSLSSNVAPLVGEYERTSTTAADAYVKPLVRRYVSDLIDQLAHEGFDRQIYMVLSSGGITSATAAMEFPVRLLESGPAAGAFAASFFGKLAGERGVLSFDMGGTTAKACLVEESTPDVARMLEADRTHRFMPGSGLPIMVPTVDLIETGAGGGSIARINELGLLNVGPASAGADPGPASYGLGGELPTVTDANVVLGYLDPGYFLGGRMALDPARAEQAVTRFVAEPLNLSLVDAAWGIHAVVNENMARAARTHIIERNRDPRQFALVAFGGAGPAHAATVAQILGISTVIVPFGAGVASAIGALVAPMALPFMRSYITPLARCDWETVRGLYERMLAEAARVLGASPDGNAEPTLSLAADMRFAGQYHELRVDLPPLDDLGPEIVETVSERFLERYLATYGRVPAGLAIEVINWHAVVTSTRPAISVQAETAGVTDPTPARKGERAVYFAGPEPGYRACAVYDRELLPPGSQITGPCVIEEPEATLLAPPGATVAIDPYRNAIVRLTPTGAGK